MGTAEGNVKALRYNEGALLYSGAPPTTLAKLVVHAADSTAMPTRCDGYERLTTDALQLSTRRPGCLPGCTVRALVRCLQGGLPSEVPPILGHAALGGNVVATAAAAAAEKQEPLRGAAR
jgi:hypothetical protein